MTTSAFNATVVYIQDSQSPAEKKKRLALNLMINMLSQNTDKSGKTLLDHNVHRIAEVLSEHISKLHMHTYEKAEQ